MTAVLNAAWKRRNRSTWNMLARERELTRRLAVAGAPAGSINFTEGEGPMSSIEQKIKTLAEKI
jgi:hypothetical protein